MPSWRNVPPSTAEWRRKNLRDATRTRKSIIFLKGVIPLDYQTMYREKLTSVEEALSHIQDGDAITTSLCANEPAVLLSQLHTVADAGKHIHIYSALNMGNYRYLQDTSYADRIRVDCSFAMGPNRTGHRKGMVHIVPGHLHNVTHRWADTYNPKVFLGCVSSMDEHGFLRFSLCNMHEQEMLRNADLVICEVNPNLPIVGGETEIHISEIDYLVESNMPIPTLPKEQPSEEEVKIGQFVASLVHDGDTIQLGIGGIPDAVAMSLMDKHDLGIHTEMLTSSMADLVEAGVITNRKKNFLPGKTVAAFILGNQKLYDMVHNNPSVWIMRASFVNNPSVIAKNDNMVSINTAVEVDLTGQVCSETIGSVHFSGSGGQNDTAEGAIHSKGGRSIIALHSTAKNGTISTINAIHTPGAVVTLSRNNIDYIVTEYGVASLRGRSVKDRVNNLIAVAHPDFRDQLRKDAERLLLW